MERSSIRLFHKMYQSTLQKRTLNTIFNDYIAFPTFTEIVLFLIVLPLFTLLRQCQMKGIFLFFYVFSDVPPAVFTKLLVISFINI